MRIYTGLFDKIISLENLFIAWDKFKKDKQKKKDVLNFEWRLEENIFQLHRDLKYFKYHHNPYTPFYIHDPKQRLIHKATVRDRIVHHAVFNELNPIFESTFIANSFSCRLGKGTHKGVEVLSAILRKVSGNNTGDCFALKGDIKKFFQSINQTILLKLLERKIKDSKTLWLIREIIESFDYDNSLRRNGKGLPIGNLTSQLFANIYLNELDQFVKHQLNIKNYVRYTDDFVIVDNDKNYLKSLIKPIDCYLREKLALNLHPNKVIIRKFHQGIDFLGYIILPYYRLPRTKTKKRIFFKLKHRVKEFKSGKISKETLNQSLQSYLGVLTHANAFKLSEELRNQFWF